MRTFSVNVTGVISAPPAACYEALADYRVAHPEIVPPSYFGPLVVEKGGFGAGTRITCSLQLLGKGHPFSADVTEPIPGRILVETIPESGAVTTFTVVNDGTGDARVTIETQIPQARGVRGVVERFITRRYFPRIYIEELGRLASYVGGELLGRPQVQLDG